jgi:hypothetical protein
MVERIIHDHDPTSSVTITRYGVETILADREVQFNGDLLNEWLETLPENARPELHFSGPKDAIACRWENQLYMLIPSRPDR